MTAINSSNSYYHQLSFEYINIFYLFGDIYLTNFDSKSQSNSTGSDSGSHGASGGPPNNFPHFCKVDAGRGRRGLNGLDGLVKNMNNQKSQ